MKVMDFSRCIPQSSEQQLDSLLLSILKQIEELTQREVIVNSAFRSISYEVRQGRNGSSAHCLGKAVDLYCFDSSYRYQVVKLALQLGINRIGIYKSFIHLDVANSKDGKNTQVIWHG